MTSAGDPTIDPTTGQISPFMHSGDPVTNTGWLQYFENPSCDIRMILGSGTFSIAPLDTQRIIYALIVGHADNRLTSVPDLKRNTNFVRDVFQNEFKLKATATAEVDFVTETQANLHITAQISDEIGLGEVKAELYDYDNLLVHTIPLFDDGQHRDGQAGDKIFSNTWQTMAIDKALYLNLKILGVMQKEYLFQHCADYITLIPNRIAITSVDVVADHLNEDGKLNPGETARINYTIQNNFPFDIGALNVWMTTDDPYIQIEPEYLFMKNIPSGKSQGIPYDMKNAKTYFTIYAATDIPDTHTIFFDVSLVDNDHHTWHGKNYTKLKLSPLEYIPNQIIPSHISGHSSAHFTVSVMQPAELTGHSYAITVVDVDEYRQGFNLIDQTLGDTLLNKQLVPDQFAFNIPVTDGFKVIQAYLAKDRVIGIFENIEGGHPTPFSPWSVTADGTMDEDLLIFGPAFNDKSIEVELEFTNDIDSSGVIGIPSGQGAFSYIWFPTAGPKKFLPSTFNAWKMQEGKRVSKLNICFWEMPPTFDGICSLRDRIYIMSSNYDSTGQYYFNSAIDEKQDLVCEVRLVISLATDSSVIDAGDKITISREFGTTSEDRWVFIPTNVQEPVNQIPATFAMYQNYPNPFNPTTTIRFSLDNPARVSLKIYNILGQEILELLDKELASGIHAVQWDGKNAAGQQVSSGLYFARLTNRNQTKLIKMLLIR